MGGGGQDFFHLGTRVNCDKVNNWYGIQGKLVETAADKHGDGDVVQWGQQQLIYEKSERVVRERGRRGY